MEEKVVAVIGTEGGGGGEVVVRADDISNGVILKGVVDGVV